MNKIPSALYRKWKERKKFERAGITAVDGAFERWLKLPDAEKKEWDDFRAWLATQGIEFKEGSAKKWLSTYAVRRYHHNSTTYAVSFFLIYRGPPRARDQW